MDNLKKTSILTSPYASMGLVFGAIFAILITLYFVLPKGFNKGLGQSTFLSVTLFYFLFTFVKFYNTVRRQGSYLETNYYSILYIGGGLLISGSLIYGIINSLGVIRSQYDAATVKQTIIDYVVIMIMTIVTFITLLYAKIKSDSVFNTMPKAIQDMNDERFKYTTLFGLFILFLCGILVYDPFHLVQKYGGVTIFIILFFSIVMFSMIYVSNYFITNPSMLQHLNSVPGLMFIFKIFYLLIGLVISGAFLYWILRSMNILGQNSAKSNNIGKIVLNFVMLAGLLGVSYKLITLGGYLTNSPFVRLITSTLLYIPCLFVYIWNNIVTTNKPNELIMLLISLFLFIGYFVFNYFVYPKSVKTYYNLMLGGKQVLNKPISTDKTTNVAGYENLNGDDKLSYEHAISFWTYIDALPPSTNASYNKPTSILSYGNNPSIKYDAKTGSLIITVPSNNENPMSVVNITKNVENKIKQVDETNVNAIEKDISNIIDLVRVIPNAPDLDNEGNKIICKIEDFELQKWNNIVINCSGETLDIFYNGSLVKSTINTISYMKYDMLVAGSDNGIIGKIANIMYYKKSLDYLTIHRLYSFFKDKTPPILQ